jgi:hypothetical protein
MGIVFVLVDAAVAVENGDGGRGSAARQDGGAVD